MTVKSFLALILPVGIIVLFYARINTVFSLLIAYSLEVCVGLPFVHSLYNFCKLIIEKDATRS